MVTHGRYAKDKSKKNELEEVKVKKNELKVDTLEEKEINTIADKIMSKIEQKHHQLDDCPECRGQIERVIDDHIKSKETKDDGKGEEEEQPNWGNE